MFISVLAAVCLAIQAPTVAQDKPETSEASQKETPAVTPTTADHVKRATFTSSVVEREPVDSVDSLKTDVDQIFFFTEIVDMAGKTVTHRWIYGGEVVAEVPFQIGGPRWRVYSSKKLVPGWAGMWKVTVVDDAGTSLREDTFVYLASAE
jgi:hypothetical protein